MKLEDLEFLIKTAENYFSTDKPVPEGLCPMFYHTLTFQDDIELNQRVKRIRDEFECQKQKEKTEVKRNF